jgi:hypothetical protein
VGLTFFLLGCGGLTLVSPLPPTSVDPTQTSSPPFNQTQDKPATITPIFFPTNTSTATPSETPLPTFPFTPTLTLEPQWSWQGPDQVIVPILLYHHIGLSLQGDTTYYISPDIFDKQMNLLYQWGYQTISVELLVRSMKTLCPSCNGTTSQGFLILFITMWESQTT